MKPRKIVAAVALAGAFALAVRGGDEPPAKAKPPVAKKPVYDETADAKALIKAALSVAKQDNRRVLIQWGYNACKWCGKLEEQFHSDADLRKTLLYEYVVVHVDVGFLLDRNADLHQHYKIVPKAPSLTVLDADDKVLANQVAVEFAVKSDDASAGFDAKKLQEFLTAHKAEPLKAEAVLDAALAAAAKTERGVFLHFGAPWCGWCHRLEAWLAQPKIAATLGKDFVDAKIDQDRMTGAKEVFARYNAKGNGGIPWFVFLDGKGKVVATSDGPKGNIGFPAEPHEIDHFVVMLKAAKNRLTDDDLDALRRSLVPPGK